MSKPLDTEAALSVLERRKLAMEKANANTKITIALGTPRKPTKHSGVNIIFLMLSASFVDKVNTYTGILLGWLESDGAFVSDTNVPVKVPSFFKKPMDEDELKKYNDDLTKNGVKLSDPRRNRKNIEDKLDAKDLYVGDVITFKTFVDKQGNHQRYLGPGGKFITGGVCSGTNVYFIEKNNKSKDTTVDTIYTNIDLTIDIVNLITGNSTYNAMCSKVTQLLRLPTGSVPNYTQVCVPTKKNYDSLEDNNVCMFFNGIELSEDKNTYSKTYTDTASKNSTTYNTFSGCISAVSNNEELKAGNIKINCDDFSPDNMGKITCPGQFLIENQDLWKSVAKTLVQYGDSLIIGTVDSKAEEALISQYEDLGFFRFINVKNIIISWANTVHAGFRITTKLYQSLTKLAGYYFDPDLSKVPIAPPFQLINNVREKRLSNDDIIDNYSFYVVLPDSKQQLLAMYPDLYKCLSNGYWDKLFEQDTPFPKWKYQIFTNEDKTSAKNYCVFALSKSKEVPEVLPLIEEAKVVKPTVPAVKPSAPEVDVPKKSVKKQDTADEASEVSGSESVSQSGAVKRSKIPAKATKRSKN